MIKYTVKEYDTKSARYIVLVIHDSGLAAEIGIGLKDSIATILDVLNQIGALLEKNTNHLFYGDAKNAALKSPTTPFSQDAGEGPATPSGVRNNTSAVQSNAERAEGDMSYMSQSNDSSPSRPPASDTAGKEKQTPYQRQGIVL